MGQSIGCGQHWFVPNGANPITMKRLLFTSDLHVGKTTLAQVRALKDRVLGEIRSHDVEIAGLFLLGDLGESLAETESSLQVLADLAPLRAMIPGNHDLFDTERLGSSLKKYRVYLPALAAKQGYSWGENAPVIIEDTLAVVMTPAWPRPEFVPPGCQWTTREMREWKRQELPDGLWIRDIDDESMAEEQLNRFQRNLAGLPDSVQRVIVACHTPPFPELYAPEGKPKPTDGYFISPCFGEVIRRFNAERPRPLVTDVVSGHLHQGRRVVLPSGTSTVPIVAKVIASAYGKPDYVLLDAQEIWEQEGRPEHDVV
jgi:predicted phosphohydrolase